MLKKVILAALVLGAIGGGIGIYMFNKPLDKVASMKTDVQLKAEQLLAKYEKDENQANVLYLDKVLEVSGIVDKVENNEEKASVYLFANNDLSSVICQMNSTEGISIKKGDNVTIKGICTGYLMDVILVRSVLVK